MGMFTSLLQFIGVLIFIGTGLAVMFAMIIAFLIMRDEERGL